MTDTAARYETCERCGNGNFRCGSCGADDYVFPLATAPVAPRTVKQELRDQADALIARVNTNETRSVREYARLYASLVSSVDSAVGHAMDRGEDHVEALAQELNYLAEFGHEPALLGAIAITLHRVEIAK
jgi:hypothetical protein